jgi:regulator of protease activity HflC (stomatin/prohibitin superfamily)
MTKSVAIALLLATACSYQSVLPGHKALVYDPSGGLRREIVGEGRHKLGHFCAFHACQHLVDFDVTYSTKHEDIHTTSQEGLALELRLAIIYKPIINELYELDSEVGEQYYDEVVAPEFRSAASGVFAHHSYTELVSLKEKIEDEIERDVQRRIQGKHVAIASITLEGIEYAPEIAAAVRARIVSEQESLRQRAAIEQEAASQKAKLENDALEKKMSLENETARAQLTIQNKAAEEKLRLETELDQKKNERAIAEEDAQLEKARAAGTLAKAHAEAEAITIMARAHAEENRAQTASISPLTVQLEAYKALGQLGGSGTTIMLGDFSHLPQWLFPPGVMNGIVPIVPTGTGAPARSARTP